MKKIMFTIADNRNLHFAKKLENSLRKFHSEEELPLVVVTEEQVKATNDPAFYYRATPKVAVTMMDEYDLVIKADADQIIMGDLSHIWNEEEPQWDVAVVQNGNPREIDKQSVSVWNIDPLSYVNAGLVVMRSKQLVEHWHMLCHSPHFPHYQYKEQDLLNIIVFYGNYNVRFLDNSKKWHGLVSKGYEPIMKLRKGKVFLPKNPEWPANEKKQIVCYHWAGGEGDVTKGKHNIRFSPEVAKHIDYLISDDKKTK